MEVVVEVLVCWEYIFVRIIIYVCDVWVNVIVLGKKFTKNDFIFVLVFNTAQAT